MFVLQNAPAKSWRFRVDAELRWRVDSGTSKFDLTMFLEETNEGLLAWTLEYSTDLFEAVSIRRLLKHYELLLQGVVADSDRGD